jgi:hypothetical protein
VKRRAFLAGAAGLAVVPAAAATAAPPIVNEPTFRTVELPFTRSSDHAWRLWLLQLREPIGKAERLYALDATVEVGQ